MKPERRTILFSGHVQGVGFRMTVVHLAEDLSIAGAVRNLPDGRVELVVEGSKNQIDSLIRRLSEHFEGLIRNIQQDVSPMIGIPGSGIRIMH